MEPDAELQAQRVLLLSVLSERQERLCAEDELQKQRALLLKWKRENRTISRMGKGVEFGVHGLIWGYFIWHLSGHLDFFHGFIAAMSSSIGSSMVKGMLIWKKLRHQGIIKASVAEMTKKLANSGDGRAVPLLLDAFEFNDMTTNRNIELGLSRLLPRVREAHIDLFTAQNRAQLYRLLRKYRRNPPAERAALIHAIGQVGDRHAVNALEKLLQQDPTSAPYAGMTAEIGQALVTLNARLKRERTGESLLRASIAPVAAPETLLRPASYASPAEPQQLLRASHSQSE